VEAQLAAPQHDDPDRRLGDHLVEQRALDGQLRAQGLDLGDLLAHPADSGDLAAAVVDRVVAHPPGAQHPRRRGRLALRHRAEDGTAVPHHRAHAVHDVAGDARQRLGHRLAQVRLDRQPVDLGERGVQPPVAQVAVPEAEADRRPLEQRVDQAALLVAFGDVERRDAHGDELAGLAQREGVDRVHALAVDHAVVAQRLAGAQDRLDVAPRLAAVRAVDLVERAPEVLLHGEPRRGRDTRVDEHEPGLGVENRQADMRLGDELIDQVAHIAAARGHAGILSQLPVRALARRLRATTMCLCPDRSGAARSPSDW
jgi:hypothetical protein